MNSSRITKGKKMQKDIQEKLNRTAGRMAQHANDNLMHTHRGVEPSGADMYVLFGNDSYATDNRSKAEAEAVRQAACDEGLYISDIQTSEDGYTWAIAAICDEETADYLADVMHDTWFSGSHGRINGEDSK